MNTTTRPARALIADDERLMREQLRARLAEVWPELEIVAEAKNGLEAVELTQAQHPDLVYAKRGSEPRRREGIKRSNMYGSLFPFVPSCLRAFAVQPSSPSRFCNGLDWRGVVTLEYFASLVTTREGKIVTR